MKTKTSRIASAALALLAATAAFLSYRGSLPSDFQKPNAQNPDPSIPARLVQDFQQPHSGPSFRQLTWIDLNVPELRDFLQRLNEFGVDGVSILALAKARIERLYPGKTLEAQSQRAKAEAEAEEQIAQLGHPIAASETSTDLAWLPPNRRQEIAAALAPIKKQIRDLERKNAGGEWSSEDYQDWKRRNNEHRQALLAELAPSELTRWIRQESDEARRLRELPLELPQNQFDAIADAKWELNQTLADDDNTDADRASARESFHKKLETTLGPDAAQQFLRAEDPHYQAFVNLESPDRLGLSREQSDYAFQWFQEMERLENQQKLLGLDDADIARELRPRLEQAEAHLREVLGAEKFERFKTTSQGLFLAGAEPADAEEP